MSSHTQKFDVLTKILLAIVLGGVLLLQFEPEVFQHGGSLSPASERRAGPDFSLQDMNGNLWSLTAQRGRVVVVNYWASWCKPCRLETPGLVRVANEYRARGVEFAGISLDEDLSAVREFVAAEQIPYAILLASNAPTLTLGIESIPVTVLYDRQGRLARRYVGAVSESELKRDIDQLLS